MALVTLTGGAFFPAPPQGIASGFAFAGASLIDGASDKVGTWFLIPKTGNVRKIHWCTRTVTTGATVDVRLETAVSTTGTWTTGAGGTNTLLGTDTNGAQVVGSGDDNTAFATTLTADAAVTRGQACGVVIVNPPSSHGNMVIGSVVHGAEGTFPYSAIDTAGAGTYAFGVNQNWRLLVALEYDDGTVEPITGIEPPATAISSTTFGTGSTPDVAGLRFQLPFTCRISGAWVAGDNDGAFDVKLVSTAYHQVNQTGILATHSHPGDQRRTGAGGWYWIDFAAGYVVTAGVTYRLIVEATGVATDVVLDTTVPSLLLLDAYPGGRNFHLTTAKNPTGDGDWTNYNSGTFRRPHMGLVIDQFADDTGSGGGDIVMPRVFTGF